MVETWEMTMQEPRSKRYQDEILHDVNFRPGHLTFEEKLLSCAISDAEFNDFLRRVHPKLYERMRGKLDSAARDLKRLYRRQQNRALCIEVEKLGLDPNQPLPRELAERHEETFSLRVKELEKRLRETVCPIFQKIRNAEPR